MISKTAEYALRATVHLTATAQPTSADQLAEKTQVPRRYLTRILQDLSAKGMVCSRPGPGGGYELTEKASQATILDILNAVEPIERIKVCPLGIKSHTALCPLHSELDRAYAATEQAFSSVKLRDLVDSTHPILPLCGSSNG